MFHRMHAVFPGKDRQQVPAGRVRVGYVLLLHRFMDVGSEALGVCLGVAGFVNALIRAAGQMLHKAAVNPFIYFTYFILAFQNYPCVFHRSIHHSPVVFLSVQETKGRQFSKGASAVP